MSTNNNSEMGGRFVEPVDLAMELEADVRPEFQHIPHLGEAGGIVTGLLTEAEVASLTGELAAREWEPVGRDGILDHFDPERDEVGSWRTTSHNEAIAQKLWERIADVLPEVRRFDKASQTDWDEHADWRPVGVNPRLRFIQYRDGGLLVPHYDAPHVYDDRRRTLMSLVCYLAMDDTIQGGDTRFLHDPQVNVPVAERDLSDHTELASESDVVFRVAPKIGSAVLFDHRILHDGAPVSGEGHKILVRTDIEFEKVEA